MGDLVPDRKHARHDFMLKGRTEGIIELRLEPNLGSSLLYSLFLRTFTNLLLIPYMIGIAAGSEMSTLLGLVRTMAPYVSCSFL